MFDVVPTANHPPVASNDSYTARRNWPLIIRAPGVLANDTDPEGSALRASLVQRPKHGWLLLLPRGGFVYLPKRHFVGTDTFTYRATDGVSASNVATVEIRVTR